MKCTPPPTMGSTSTSTAQAGTRVRALRDILALIEDARLTDHQRPRLLAARRRVGPQECDGENGTRRSRPPGSTCTPCLPPTRRTSMPSLASPIDAGEPVFQAGASKNGRCFRVPEQIAGRCLRRLRRARACFSLSRDSHRAQAVYLGLRPHGSDRRVTLPSRGYAQANWRCCRSTDTPTPCRRWHHTSRHGERPCAPDR